ncbi:MAG: isoaspartyl aminopeptidase [Chitinophagaceae bacterium]|nr:isoaspartyl aminopeptidase [Chitinophagaceae bacterium]
MSSTFAIVIHGGAGTISKKEMTDELEKAFLQGLTDAINAGYSVLEKGGTAIRAAQASVMSLEDNELFNAGKGSVFTRKGIHEMDAAIMDGKTLGAGAVAGVRNIRNPIELAAEVMLNSDHVLLSGEGANEFALYRKLKIEPTEYFFSKTRYDQWKEARDSEDYVLDHNHEKSKEKRIGTVGAVALDSEGNVAAATSTGGMTNKNFGRLGDTPVIGSGTYANNRTAAISCTGHGEMFIRAVAAYDVSCLMEYKGLSLHEAMDIVVNDKLVKLKGEGGIIGVDPKGNIAMLFNSEGMYRGARNNMGLNETAIYK